MPLLSTSKQQQQQAATAEACLSWVAITVRQEKVLDLLKGGVGRVFAKVAHKAHDALFVSIQVELI